MITSEDNSIDVSATSVYLAQQSSPDEERFVFSYTITIRNTGAAPAQLLTRHWLITDSNGRIQEVHGDGVIGEQPVISPGEKHVYTSGAILETPVGTMEGSYGMRSDNGESFKAAIPVFRLAVPDVLN